MHLHQHVPLDIINEIRGRLPPKSLVRFRCISKGWNDISNDPDLSRKQLQRSGKISDPQLLCRVNFRRDEGGTITSKISKKGIEISIPLFNSFLVATSTCNGWHCFSAIVRRSHHDRPILMHNPLRQETLELPQIWGFTTKDGHPWYGLGFDATNNLFKLTCLFVSGYTNEFYILRQKHFWEKLELPGSLRNCHHRYTRTVFLNGAINYIVRDGNNVFTILTFDVEKEQFRCIDLPNYRHRYPHILMELGGLLAVCSSYRGSNLYEIHILKDYAKGEWDAPLRLSVSESIMRIGRMDMDIVKDHGWVMGTRVMFCLRFARRRDSISTVPSTNQDDLVYLAYDIKTGKFTFVVSSQLPSSADYIDLYGHQLSLVPLNI